MRCSSENVQKAFGYMSPGQNMGTGMVGAMTTDVN